MKWQELLRKDYIRNEESRITTKGKTEESERLSKN